MIKALLVGNGFSSMLINSYSNENMLKEFERVAPKVYEKIKEKYEILYNLKMQTPDKSAFCDKLHEIIESKPDETNMEINNKYVLIEDNLYSELDNSSIYGIETIMKVAKLFDFTDIEKIEKIAIDICWNNGLNGINGITTDTSKIRIDISNTKKFFSHFDYIFTTNYDYILDDLCENEIFHIHGGFDYYKISYTRNGAKEVNKYNSRKEELEITEKENHEIAKIEKPYLLWGSDGKNKKNKMGGGVTFPITLPMFFPMSLLRQYVDKLEKENINELHIFGYSGLNDNHINNAIKSNQNIETIIFYCDPKKEVNSDEFHKEIINKFQNKKNTIILMPWSDIWERLE